jgi:CRISPR-associated protein Csb1
MTAAQLLDQLDGERYLAIEVDLEPLGALTIQPTTFANTGPSFYEAPDGQLAAVVDSVASMANQLELTIWDEAACEPVTAVAPLPWVKVVDGDGAYYTSSRRAAHRLNAHSVLNGVDDKKKRFGDRLKEQLPPSTPPPVERGLAAALWQYDPLTLIHGCWFTDIWSGRARVPRVLSARIDALEVQSQAVQIGGQKTRDSVAEPIKSGEGTQRDPEEKEFDTVLGEVPTYGSEVSASRIVSAIVLDLGLLRSYGLPDPAYRGLVATGVLQIAELIAAWPRRRSRCILEVKEITVRRPAGLSLPPLDDLRTSFLPDLRNECLKRCREATGVERAEPLVVRWTHKKAATS